MNRVWTCGMIALMAVALSAFSYGQETPPPALDSTPAPATDYTPAAPGAIAGPQEREAFPAPASTAQPQPGEATTGTRYREQSASVSPQATTSSRHAIPPGQPAVNGQLEGGARTAGERAELGVWLVESGGPGVAIRRITEGSAAHQAGLQSGDVILQVNGRGASSPHEVAQLIREMPPGEVATIQYWRDGQIGQMEIALQPMREPYQVAFRGDEPMMRSRGDLESRTQRLEEQLAMVVQELRQLREELAQSRTSGIGQPGAGAGTTSESATSTTTTGAETTITQPPATQPSGVEASDPFGTEATEPGAAATPATEPATTETETITAEETTPDSDAAPAEGEAATEETPGGTEAAPAETEESDDLFE